MGQYAPGTQNFDAGIPRRDSRVFQRRQNVSDILAGFGAIAQTLGQVRRAHEAEANDALYTQKLGELMQGGVSPQQPPAITAQNVPAMAEDVPQGWQGYQPPTPAPRDPGASYDAGVMQAAQPSASSFLERMGRTFTPWTNGGYQPKLSGQQAASLIQMRQGMAAQAGASARESRKLALDEAQAAETARHNRADEGIKARGTVKPPNFDNDVNNYNKFTMESGRLKAFKSGIERMPLVTDSDALVFEKMAGAPDADPLMKSIYADMGTAGLTTEERRRAKSNALSRLDDIIKIYDSEASRWRPATDARERMSRDLASSVLGTPSQKSGSPPDASSGSDDDAKYEEEWMARHNKTPEMMTAEDEDQMLADYKREHPGG
jgi:hypothetical protein